MKVRKHYFNKRRLILSFQKLLNYWSDVLQQKNNEEINNRKQIPNLKIMLDEFDKVIRERKVAKYPICNVFKESQGKLNENDHSNTLRFLLDPNESHGLELAFMKKIMKVIGKDSFLKFIENDYKKDKKKIYVNREISGEESRIDIEIIGPSFLVWIENKLKAVETLKGRKYQTSREWDDLCRKAEQILGKEYEDKLLAIFLTPPGAQPTQSEFIPLSYEEISQCLWEISLNIDSKKETFWSLRHYSEFIDYSVRF